MLDNEIMETILGQLEDVDTINITRGCEVKGEYHCGDETVTIGMTDTTGALGALAAAYGRLVEYNISEDEFSHGEVSFDALITIAKASELIHNAIAALMIRDPSAKILRDEPDDEE